MNIPETFYIALCVSILLLGVVYWFWTQVQYLQRKVNLLDNVVYEMKTLVSNLPGPPPPVATAPAQAQAEPIERRTEEAYAPPPESVAGDLEAERNISEMEFDNFSGSVTLVTQEAEPKVPDELQPGGLAVAAEPPKKTVDDNAIESPLSGMSIKELRRMGEANGIPGSGELKKRELIRALRDKVNVIINNEPPKVISFDEIDAPVSE